VLPEWAINCIDYWKQILMLGEWTLRTKVVPRPDNDEQARACVAVHTDTLIADIEIRDDLSQDYDHEWELTIIHELLHVRLGRITDFVQRDLIPELASAAQSLAYKSLTREVEPTVELLAAVLLKLRGNYDGKRIEK